MSRKQDRHTSIGVSEWNISRKRKSESSTVRRLINKYWSNSNDKMRIFPSLSQFRSQLSLPITLCVWMSVWVRLPFVCRQAGKPQWAFNNASVYIYQISYEKQLLIQLPFSPAVRLWGCLCVSVVDDMIWRPLWNSVYSSVFNASHLISWVRNNIKFHVCAEDC